MAYATTHKAHAAWKHPKVRAPRADSRHPHTMLLIICGFTRLDFPGEDAQGPSSPGIPRRGPGLTPHVRSTRGLPEP